MERDTPTARRRSLTSWILVLIVLLVAVVYPPFGVVAGVVAGVSAAIFAHTMGAKSARNVLAVVSVLLFLWVFLGTGYEQNLTVTEAQPPTEQSTETTPRAASQ